MPVAHDHRRLAKLAANVTERERLTIERAVEHWQIRHGQSYAVNPDIRGQVLTSICEVYMDAETEAMRGA